MSHELLPALTDLLSVLILLFALSISSATTVKDMIDRYRGQALILAVIVLLTATEPQRASILPVIVVPLFLFFAVKPFLGRATVTGPGAPTVRFWRSLLSAAQEAEITWLQQGASLRSPIISAAIELVLTVVAFIVAYSLTGGQQGGAGKSGIDTTSLAVAMALLLLGLFTMTNKKDIISQIIGLLVVEHGLFLAAVKILKGPNLGLALDFVLSLIVYVAITLTILIGILPDLHRRSGSIELDKQKQLKG